MRVSNPPSLDNFMNELFPKLKRSMNNNIVSLIGDEEWGGISANINDDHAYCLSHIAKVIMILRF